MLYGEEFKLNNHLIFDFTEFKTETLVLSRLVKSQAGNYTCKSTNRHGSSISSFYLDIICKLNLNLSKK